MGASYGNTGLAKLLRFAPSQQVADKPQDFVAVYEQLAAAAAPSPEQKKSLFAAQVGVALSKYIQARSTPNFDIRHRRLPLLYEIPGYGASAVARMVARHCKQGGYRLGLAPFSVSTREYAAPGAVAPVSLQTATDLYEPQRCRRAATHPRCMAFLSGVQRTLKESLCIRRNTNGDSTKHEGRNMQQQHCLFLGMGDCRPLIAAAQLNTKEQRSSNASSPPLTLTACTIFSSPALSKTPYHYYLGSTPQALTKGPIPEGAGTDASGSSLVFLPYGVEAMN